MPRMVFAVGVLLSWLAIAAAALALEPSKSTDWPQWRGPNRDNKSSEKGLNMDWEASPPKLDWKLDGMGEGFASVSIVGNRLYTTGNTGGGQSVIAVDLANKSVAWSKAVTESNPKHGYDGSRCTPSVDGDRLYVVTSNGQITCLGVADGTVIWKREFKEWGGKMMSGWGFSESPLVDGPWVLCTPGGSGAMIVALDKMTGKEVWTADVPDVGDAGKSGAGYSSIVISEGAGVKQYVQLIGRGLVSVRASDGKHLWSYNRIANKTADIPSPIVQGDYVFGSSGYGDGGSALLKLEKSADGGVTAVEKYYRASRDLQNHHGGMVLLGDHLYFGHGHNNGFPVCVDLYSGDIKWGGQLRGVGNGSAAITYVDGHVVFRYQSGHVALIEATPTDYKLKGSFMPEVKVRESWAHPVVSRGKLYLREQNTLMCYDLTKN